MFLDERFTHKCSLIKRYLIRFTDRPVPKMLDISQCGSTANDVSILYTASVLTLRRESFSSSAITPSVCSLVKTSRIIRLKRLRMRDEDLTAICDRTKKKSSRNFDFDEFMRTKSRSKEVKSA